MLWGQYASSHPQIASFAGRERPSSHSQCREGAQLEGSCRYEATDLLNVRALQNCLLP